MVFKMVLSVVVSLSVVGDVSVIDPSGGTTQKDKGVALILSMVQVAAVEGELIIPATAVILDNAGTLRPGGESAIELQDFSFVVFFVIENESMPGQLLGDVISNTAICALVEREAMSNV